MGLVAARCRIFFRAESSNLYGTYIKEIEEPMSDILHVKPEAWKTIETSTKPVFVDFWAGWCGPCRMLAPTVEKLAAKYGNEITFAKVDVDELSDVASRFGIQSIPTLLLLRDGRVVERIVGLRSFEELAGVLDRHLVAATKR